MHYLSFRIFEVSTGKYRGGESLVTMVERVIFLCRPRGRLLQQLMNQSLIGLALFGGHLTQRGQQARRQSDGNQLRVFARLRRLDFHHHADLDHLFGGNMEE